MCVDKARLQYSMRPRIGRAKTLCAVFRRVWYKPSYSIGSNRIESNRICNQTFRSCSSTRTVDWHRRWAIEYGDELGNQGQADWRVSQDDGGLRWKNVPIHGLHLCSPWGHGAGETVSLCVATFVGTWQCWGDLFEDTRNGGVCSCWCVARYMVHCWCPLCSGGQFLWCQVPSFMVKDLKRCQEHVQALVVITQAFQRTEVSSLPVERVYGGSKLMLSGSRCKFRKVNTSIFFEPCFSSRMVKISLPSEVPLHSTAIMCVCVSLGTPCDSTWKPWNTRGLGFQYTYIQGFLPPY